MKKRFLTVSVLFISILLAAAFVTAINRPISVSAAPASCSGLFFSEYIEGSSNNKALEIYNGTGTAVDLGSEGYQVLYYMNGSSTPGFTDTLSGILADGDVYVIADDGADSAILAQADFTSTHNYFNGDDAVVLMKGSQVVDAIGKVGENPSGSAWGSGMTSTKDHTLVRKASVSQGDTNTGDAFDPADEWDGYAKDTFSYLGSHSATCQTSDTPPSVSHTTPANHATDIETDSAITITFSEAVTVTGSWYGISCSASGAHAATVSGGTTTYVLDPTADFTNSETCTTTVYAAQVTDQDGTPDHMTSDAVFSFETKAPVLSFGSCGDNNETRIHTIQGSGSSSPMVGSRVVVEGIVVGDYQSNSQLKGFFLQEETVDEDTDTNTSEGIFVYYKNLNVSEGDVVRVIGDVKEQYGLTEITNVGNAQICTSVGESIATPSVTLPLASAGSLEKYEGMKVSLPQKLYVTNHYNLSRYGQFWVSSSSRLWQPTHITTPGASANSQEDANKLNEIIIDDASNKQNPDPIVFPPPELTYSNTLRAGTALSNMQAVLGYGYGKYMFYPISYQTASPDINKRSQTPPEVGGSFKVASFNVLNYFNGDGDGTGFDKPDQRGADNLTEFNRQRTKIINAIIDLDADIIGLMEIENDGYVYTSAIVDLVDGLNAASPISPTFAYIDPGVTKIGDDAIAVGLIYRVETALPIGSAKILDNSYNSEYHDDKNRPALAQTFEQKNTGERFTVVVNHLKSKGSSCSSIGDPNTHDGQGNCNLTRKKAAEIEAQWLATDPTGSGDPDFILIGDFNSYRNEDPITALTNASYTDLLRHFVGDTAYSYGYKGEWGYLDYAFANSTTLPQVAGASVWHINADEPHALDYNLEYKDAHQQTSLYGSGPFRASDHDPVIVGLYDYDFSDLPASYGIAYHKGGGQLRLGRKWDALSDTSNGADNATDDGVSITAYPSTTQLQASAAITVSAPGFLAAWFDWDGNGVFDNGEIAITITLPTTGTQVVTFSVPQNFNFTIAQDINARFRFYPAMPAAVTPTGSAEGGEVEDYTFHFSIPATYKLYLPLVQKNTP